MQRINIGGMSAYNDLRRHARERRDRDIQAARERYADTIDQIYMLQARNGQRGFELAYYNRGVRYFSADVPITKLTLIAAAERVLSESKSLRLVELVVELQRRGVRESADPRRLAISLRSAFGYHRHRFICDRFHRWTLV
jgi:hypothetical protein